MTRAEQQALRADAERHLVQLQQDRARLLPSADDPYALSELVSIDSEISSTTRALGESDAL
jgi:hypothetical protein